MIIVVRSGAAEVIEPDDLTALAVQTVLPPNEFATAVNALSLGLVDPDGAHVWLEPRVLRGSEGAEPSRIAALASMIAFAEPRGWVDTAGRIRAHVERKVA